MIYLFQILAAISGAAAPPPAGNFLLAENGDFLIAENGDFLILE
jgi:hypothetical protein